MLMEKEDKFLEFIYQNVIVSPIVIPLLSGAVMLLLADTKRSLRTGISLFSVILQLLSGITLLILTKKNYFDIWLCNIGVYAIGGWPAPFGIVLVADRLAAIMLVLTSVIGFNSLLYAINHWDRVGVHFYSLFQFLLMGLNGAFLTGDLFNLFVFFEVLLAASYGLMLHGSGSDRVGASLHYIVVNLVVSFLLLVSIGLIYGVTGTLNLADLASSYSLKLSNIDYKIFNIGFAILGLAFMVKAGVWPLNFWLVRGYALAAPPIGAMFSMLTKVGVYAILRISSLIFPNELPAPFNLNWIFPIGLITLLFGCFGLLVTQPIEKLSGYCTVISVGTLLMVLGVPSVPCTTAALFYLVNSALAISTLFLLAELVGRTRTLESNFFVERITNDFESDESKKMANRPDDVVGVPIPVPMAFLGLSFVSCALLIVGLPPFSGFIAKLSLLLASISLFLTVQKIYAWILIFALLFSGVSALLVFTRIGIKAFWSRDTIVPSLKWLEITPIGILIFLCFALSITANPILSYMQDTALSLNNPSEYINAVLSSSILKLKLNKFTIL